MEEDYLNQLASAEHLYRKSLNRLHIHWELSGYFLKEIREQELIYQHSVTKKTRIIPIAFLKDIKSWLKNSDSITS